MVALVQTDTNRFTAHDMQYFTPGWEQRGDIDHEVSDRKPTEKPENYELMLELVEKLAAGLPHVRVDLYNIAGRPYFGEMTFYTGGGFDPFMLMKSSQIGLIANSVGYSCCRRAIMSRIMRSFRQRETNRSL